MISRVRGTIARRILLNYRIDPSVVRPFLPPGFEPKLANGYAIGGICLIRLERARPAGVPLGLGVSSENAAHRFGTYRVEGEQREDCVYIARRHTSSRFTLALGGLSPVEQRAAHFEARDDGETIDVSFSGSDGTQVHARVRRVPRPRDSSAFGTIDEASAYFRGGALGYSEKRASTTLDALRLETRRWEMTPLAVDLARSSFFDDQALFPSGSIELDGALLMENVEHEWLRASASVAR